jgi:hypothetical protein
MNNKASSRYLSIFGVVLLVIGILVAYLSVNMVQDDSALSSSSIMLLLGVLAGVVGVALFLVGFFNTKHRTSYPYY